MTGDRDQKRKNQNPTIKTRDRDSAPKDWHEEGELPDGTPVGKAGALWFVLDNDGVPVSNGFHEIRIRDNGYEGKIGARRETFQV